MLMAADYDTHDCISNYARRRGSLERMSLELLLRRTELRLLWELGARATPDTIDRSLSLRLGLDEAASQVASAATDMKNMTEEERVDLYVNLCKTAGIMVTAEELMGRK